MQLRKFTKLHVVHIYRKLVWRSGRVEECNHGECGFAPRWCLFAIDSFVGKLTENGRKVDGKWSESWRKISQSANALKIFHLLSRNSSDKLVQHVEKVFRHPDTWVLRHPVRLAKFSVNSFYSVCSIHPAHTESSLTVMDISMEV